MHLLQLEALEEKLGHKPSWEERDAFELEQKKEIKNYCNKCSWTDVDPYEVVSVISDITVEVKAMKVTLVKAPQDFHPGGFVGHYSDNRAQEWSYKSDPDAPVTRVRWSKANHQWQKGKHVRFIMSDKPYKFYDYNF